MGRELIGCVDWKPIGKPSGTQYLTIDVNITAAVIYERTHNNSNLSWIRDLGFWIRYSNDALKLWNENHFYEKMKLVEGICFPEIF